MKNKNQKNHFDKFDFILLGVCVAVILILAMGDFNF